MNELMTELLNELIKQVMNSEHLCMYATELYDTVLKTLVLKACYKCDKQDHTVKLCWNWHDILWFQ